MEDLEDELMQCLSQQDTPVVEVVVPEEVRDQYVLEMATPPAKEITVELPMPQVEERPTSEARVTL